MITLQVVVPKAKGEILGVVIVESGWGSMLPTIVLANLLPSGPAARCGQLNIGDQVILWKKKKLENFFQLCIYLFRSLPSMAFRWLAYLCLLAKHISRWATIWHWQNSSLLAFGLAILTSLVASEEIDLERKQLVDLWIFYGRKSRFLFPKEQE